MSLNAQLTAMKQASVAKTDPAILTVMKNARQQVEDSGILNQALAAGETMPDFVLRDAAGTEFSSRDALRKGPLVISWYRGIW